ncbi:hypothetical protein BH23ACT2_BH23ACT2_31390 [soil metagenome]
MTELPPGAGPVDRLVTGSRVREWEVVRFVARGAFGQVFEARRDSWVDDEPTRALKVFDPILSSAARSTLLNEFTVLRTIRHPNLVAGEDAFDLADGDLAGSVVFVMELADTDLASVIARQGPVEAAQVAALGADVARGLRALHDAGHLHGDVKPENVLIAGGTWKLGDFGVSTALQGSYAHPGGATLDFRPPEVSEADTASRVHRSADIWALGVTLWMAVTGSHPYVGADSQLRYAAVLRGDRRATPSTLDRRFIELLDRRCLTSDPHRRSDATELAQDLHALAEELAADPVGPASARFTVTPLPQEVSTSASAAPPRAEAPPAPTVADPPGTEPHDQPDLHPPPDPGSPLEQPTAPVDPPIRWADAPPSPSPAPPSDAPASTSVPVPVAAAERSGGRPWWFGVVVGGVAAAAAVEASSLVAAVVPGGLGARRAVYGVLIVILAVAAGLVARQRGWTRDPVAVATRAAAAAAVVVVLLSTAVLFWAAGQ